MGKFIDMTGWEINDWHIIQKDLNNKDKTIKWSCQCKRCHNIKSVRGSDIRSGKSKNCGCLRKEKISQRNRQTYKDITGQHFGLLQALYPTEKRQNTYIVWHCKCLCGNEKDICYHDLIEGNVHSCGCMTISKGELAIKTILEQNKIPFKQEATFSTCFFPDTKQLARFDFYVDNKFLIEFDGSQHFSSMQYNNCGWNTEENFQKTLNHDKIKNKWCKDNNIPLIRIPYTHYKNITIEDLKPETSKFIIA